MKWFINKNKSYRVQAYGKLPIYKDYINWVTRSESIAWRNWMLDTFNADNVKIPKGLWGFIFQGTGKSALVAGLIEQSSDGIREFPISIFTVMDAISLTDRTVWHQTVEIINQLTFLRASLKEATHIDACYDMITTKMLHVKKDNFQGNRSSFDFRDQLQERQYILPLLLVLPDLSGSPGFFADAMDSGHDIIKKWSALS